MNCERMRGTGGDHASPVVETRYDLWFGEPEVVDGSIDRGDEPGFGVRLNEELL